MPRRWTLLASALVHVALVPASALSKEAAHSAAAGMSCGFLGERLGMPQVALLFLLLSPQPRLDVLWQPWLEAAAGLLPASAVKPCGDGSAAAGGAEEVEGAALLCGLLAGNETVPAVHRQLLFNVYATWHSTFVLGRQEEQPLFGQERSGPGLLAGVHVVDPPSARAKFSSPATLLSRTVRALLAEALAAPRNTRFLLLSDAHAPLYPATATYLVALHGEDATVLEPDDCPKRPLIFVNRGGSTSAWFAANRSTSEAAAQAGTAPLACGAGSSYSRLRHTSELSDGLWHASELTPLVLRSARHPLGCHSDTVRAVHAAARAMLHVGAVLQPPPEGGCVPAEESPLGPKCPLFLWGVARDGLEAASQLLGDGRGTGELQGYEQMPRDLSLS